MPVSKPLQFASGLARQHHFLISDRPRRSAWLGDKKKESCEITGSECSLYTIVKKVEFHLEQSIRISDFGFAPTASDCLQFSKKGIVDCRFWKGKLIRKILAGLMGFSRKCMGTKTAILGVEGPVLSTNFLIWKSSKKKSYNLDLHSAGFRE